MKKKKLKLREKSEPEEFFLYINLKDLNLKKCNLRLNRFFKNNNNEKKITENF